MARRGGGKSTVSFLVIGCRRRKVNSANESERPTRNMKNEFRLKFPNNILATRNSLVIGAAPHFLPHRIVSKYSFTVPAILCIWTYLLVTLLLPQRRRPCAGLNELKGTSKSPFEFTGKHLDSYIAIATCRSKNNDPFVGSISRHDCLLLPRYPCLLLSCSLSLAASLFSPSPFCSLN